MMATFVHFPSQTQAQLEAAAASLDADIMAAKTVVSSGAGDSSVSELKIGSLQQAKGEIYSDLFTRFPESTLLIGLTRTQVIGARRTKLRY